MSLTFTFYNILSLKEHLLYTKFLSYLNNYHIFSLRPYKVLYENLIFQLSNSQIHSPIIYIPTKKTIKYIKCY